MRVEPDFLEILATLSRHRVDFIVCGGVAAILHGAPLVTVDLEVVFDASEANCRRLLGATRELGATYVDLAGRTMVPDLSKLQSLRKHLLNTTRGRLDLMREIGAGLDYGALESRVEMADLKRHGGTHPRARRDHRVQGGRRPSQGPAVSAIPLRAAARRGRADLDARASNDRSGLHDPNAATATPRVRPREPVRSREAVEHFRRAPAQASSPRLNASAR